MRVCECDAGLGAGVSNAHHMLKTACDPMVGCLPAMLLTCPVVPLLHALRAAQTLKFLGGVTHLELSSYISRKAQNSFPQGHGTIFPALPAIFLCAWACVYMWSSWEGRPGGGSERG